MALVAGYNQWFHTDATGTPAAAGSTRLFTTSAKSVACATDGDRVGAWVDAANGWDLLQATAGERPYFQAANAIAGQPRPGVRFEPITGVTEGSHPSMAISSSLTTDRQAVTTFIVAQLMFNAGGLNNQCVWAPGATGVHGTLYFAPPTTGTNVGHAQLASSVREVDGRSFIGSQKAVYAYRSSASELAFWRNTQKFIAPGLLSSGTSTGGLLMRFTAATPWHAFGTIYEIVSYGSALSDASMTQNIAHLMSAHAIPDAYVNIVCDGDSIMAGQNVSSNTTYTSKLQNISNYIANAIPEAEVYNVAVSGQKVEDLVTYRSARCVAKYDPTKRLNIYCCIVGTNNISGGYMSAVNTLAEVKSHCLYMKGAGFKVIIATQPPRNDNTYDTERDSYNTLLRAQYTQFADGLADIASDPLLDLETDTTYFNADAIHYNSAGCGIASTYFIREIARLVEIATRQPLRGR